MKFSISITMKSSSWNHNLIKCYYLAPCFVGRGIYTRNKHRGRKQYSSVYQYLRIGHQ